MKINLKTPLVTASVAAAMLAAGAAQAEFSASGFVDVIYTVTDDGQGATPPAVSGTENKFLADGELDISGTVGGATVGLDIDVRINALGGGNNAEIEQAFFAVPIGGVTLIGGVFNNPIGYEAEDAPNLDFTSHNIIYDILNHQTALHGNNIAGAALAGKVGPVTLTGAFVNDLGHSAEDNSLALVANFSPMAGLAVEVSHVTQDASGAGNPLTAGDVTDINAVWSNDTVSLGIDWMSFEQLLDDAVVVWGGVDLGKVHLGVRHGSVSIVGGPDADQTTFYASHPLSDNVSVALEVKDGDVAASLLGAVGVLPSSVEGTRATIEFIGTF